MKRMAQMAWNDQLHLTDAATAEWKSFYTYCIEIEAKEDFIKTVESIHERAECIAALAWMHERDIEDVCNQDEQKVLKYRTNAAVQGHIASILCLAGLATTKETRFSWLLSAATLGNEQAQYSVGRAYEKGIGVKLDLHEAKTWFQRCSHHLAKAERHLGKLFVGENNLTKGVAALERAAKRGDVKAMRELGNLLFDPKTSSLPLHTRSLALHYAQSAAIHGTAQDRLNLGCKYIYGVKDKSVPHLLSHPNTAFEIGIFWLEMAAEQGLPEALAHLGVCHENGSHYPKNLDKAIECYKKAAEQNDALALANLGIIYMTQDHKQEDEAFACLSKAAQQNQTKAVYWLGTCYMNGIGVEKDETKAIKQWQLANEKGSADAKRALKDYYERKATECA
jgi:hypothetical protein